MTTSERQLADTPTNNWPDAARPGVPLNSERDGWHWLENELGTAIEACQWSGREWMHRTGLALAKEVAVAKWRYLGPCLTPAEVAAREADAFRRGAEAMRELCAKIADEHGIKNNPRWGFRTDEAQAVYDEADDIAVEIRALLLPEASYEENN